MLVKSLLIWTVVTFAAAAPPNHHPPPPPGYHPGHPPHDVFKNVTVFAPPESWASHSTSYARSLLLNQDCETDNVLLASWTFSPPDGPYLPIARSVDLGRSWEEYSRVQFTHNNYSGGIILQPFLFELPQQIGDYPPGTVLATGNAIPSDFNSTNIEMYASLDKGSTWDFVSVVSVGGAPNTTNGATPVWEPFIDVYDGQVLVYYSDQRDPEHGQKLSLQTSSDLLQWGSVINSVTYANYTLRPGMPTTARIGDGRYMISYELAFDPEVEYAVRYRLADSPLEFDKSPNIPMQANSGTIPSAGPYTVWTPSGGPHGTIVVSDSTYSTAFINTQNGDPDAWEEVETGMGVSYSRGLRVMPDESVILFMNGGYFGSSNTTVTAGEWVVPGPGPHRD